MDSLQTDFKSKSEEYIRLTHDYAKSLINEFGSNKKAREFLREQSFKSYSQEIHEFIKIEIKKLERIALDQ